ncbi:PorT family protein [Chryseobacterium nematophagum]|uniref:PorT family protein n=1 Tax=Chryseobacterium nematophagum TaxID=2305228 RepID=A0A3M7TDY3_9FLAO|nr:porin family protein [Chryseobacterium nematophagum]RNA61721.1 PorT family protein [Chryseobacterium nematophagum]
MKKLFFGLAVIACSLMSAQKSESGVKFGAKAGINISTIVDEVKLGDPRTGIYLGGFVNVPLGRFISIQPEVFYSQTGFRNFAQCLVMSYPGASSVTMNENRKANLDYISVPIMFQFNITKGFYLEAGPQFNFLVNNKQTVDITYEIANMSPVQTKFMNELMDYKINKVQNLSRKFDTKGLELGLAIGAGYYFTPKIGVNVRYSLSSSKLANQNGDRSPAVYKDTAQKTTSLLQLGLVYKF